MKKGWLFIGCLIFIAFNIHAQTTRPGVLVVGNGNAAAAAAIQSAVSGVKTTLLLQAGGFDISPIQEELQSGIQAQFLKKLNAFKGEKDSLALTDFDKQTANTVLTKWTDSLKNLTVIKNTVYTKADRSGNNWSFKLSDGKSIRPTVLVIAGDTKLLGLLGINGIQPSKIHALDYSQPLHRTSISSGSRSAEGNVASFFSLYDLLISGQENLIVLHQGEGMLLGQAAGATAAYADFFGTKTSLSNLKTIQGELINYKLALMPFSDIAETDPNWKAIQFAGLAGALKATVQNGKAFFYPEQEVTIAEIDAPFRAFYYKAQLWFDDHKNIPFTLKAAIDLICYVGNKSPESTPREIEKKWNVAYKLPGSFDLTKPVSRRLFALLLQDYMPPFNIKVDKNGNIVK